MTAKEFIISKIKAFVHDVTNAKVRYEYDDVARLHTVEVTPQSVYDSKDFDKWESSLFDEFIAAYPADEIGFISNDALVGIDNVTYEDAGKDYISFNNRFMQVIMSEHTDISVEHDFKLAEEITATCKTTYDNDSSFDIGYSDVPNNYKLAA